MPEHLIAGLVGLALCIVGIILIASGAILLEHPIRNQWKRDLLFLAGALLCVVGFLLTHYAIYSQ